MKTLTGSGQGKRCNNKRMKPVEEHNEVLEDIQHSLSAHLAITRAQKQSTTQVLSYHPMTQVLRYLGTLVLRYHLMAQVLRY